MNYNEIKQFTQANSSVNYSWKYLKIWLEEQKNEIGLELEPDFQRAHVWNDEKRSKYIEYILKGGISGRAIYFNCSSWMKEFNMPVVLVDGLQRVTAVLKFLNNEITIFDGKYFKDIEGRLPLQASFDVYVNDLPTRKEVLQWYIDLNDGGVAHTSEEIKKVKGLLELEK